MIRNKYQISSFCGKFDWPKTVAALAERDLIYELGEIISDHPLNFKLVGNKAELFGQISWTSLAESSSNQF